MQKTKIEWCDSTLNPVCGCTFGCEFCYARRLNNRFGWVEDFSKPQFFPKRLEKLKNKKPRNIFMDSMSDIADWEDEWIIETFKAIGENPQHNYLFLTKRPSVYKNWQQFCKNNIWYGTTVMNEKSYINNSVELYKSTGYDTGKNANRFLSIEPLLGEIPQHILCPLIGQFGWIILGAETGNRKGKVIPKAEWIEQIVNECDKANVPAFMKDSLIPIIGESNMRREFPRGLGGVSNGTSNLL